MSRCMLLMVAFGALAASLDSYRTTVFGSSSEIANRSNSGHTEKQNKQGMGAVRTVCCCWKLCVNAASEATMR